MPKITNVLPVTTENIHNIIPNFIIEKKIIIESYEDMIEVILEMVRCKHVFILERHVLRSIMEDLTYMYSPGDDINKERLMFELNPSDDEEESENEEEIDEQSIHDDSPPNILVDNLLQSDVEK